MSVFGAKTPEIREIANDPAISRAIKTLLVKALGHVGLAGGDAGKVAADCIKLAGRYRTLAEYEKAAHSLLEGTGMSQQIEQKIAQRAQTIYSQVRGHVTKGSLLDLGCGDGLVGALFARNGSEVMLADVREHPAIRLHGLPFKMLEQTGRLPFDDGQFDNTLVLTVLHHSDDPIHLLKEVNRVTAKGGRAVVIESVYGVDGNGLRKEELETASAYLELGAEQQRLTNVFFDHFYNRVLHYSDDPIKKVNMPFNFNTPENWTALFKGNGFREEQTVHLGIDQPAVPEYHTLHVLTKA